MDYLLTHIVDEKFSSVHCHGFLRDRTRSIRKDISTQNLCNEAIVDIIETITRFHIFCSAWHCEDGPQIFDQRMNEENLKNCLQTLKFLYTDMPPDSCRNEAEFRSYMIVLNLDKGEMLE